MDFEKLLHKIGGFGRYQIVLYISVSLVAIGVVWHNMMQVFTAAIPAHECLVEGIEKNRAVSDGDRISVGSCDVTFHNRTSFENSSDSFNGSIAETVKCSRWIFSTDFYSDTIATKWNLVCDRKWILTLAQSLHMAGCLVGAALFGALSDRYGRRIILLVTTVLEVSVGIATAFSGHWIVYVVLRAVVGLAVAGQFNCAYIMAIEYVEPRWRVLAGICMMYTNSLGIILMAGVAYLIRNWVVLQLTLSGSLIVLMTYYWTALESPRWLISHGRVEEAMRVLKRVAKINKIFIAENDLTGIVHTNQDDERPDKLKIVKAPKLCARSLILCYIWFANSIVYYGLSLNTASLGGDDYVSFLLMGVAEIPAYTFCLWSLNRVGRRPSLVGGMLFSGIALLSTRALSDDMVNTRVALAVIGKSGIAVAYATIYPFAAELFPTNIRNFSLGLCSVFARIGGLVAPCILLLDDVDRILPLLIFGFAALSGGILAMLLPETRGLPLPETIQDSEDMPYHCLVLTNCRARSVQMRNDKDFDGEHKDPLQTKTDYSCSKSNNLQ